MMCHKTSLNFVDSVWEIFGPLLAGCPLVVLQDAHVGSPHLLLRALVTYLTTDLTTDLSHR